MMSINDTKCVNGYRKELDPQINADDRRWENKKEAACICVRQRIPTNYNLT